MSQAAIRISLAIPDVAVVAVEVRAKQGLVITVESTLKMARCKRCGREIEAFHGHSDWVAVRHLPILEQAVYLRYRPKRYRCPYCEGGPTTTQQVSWHAANSPYTRAFEEYLLKMLVNSTVQDVSAKARVGYAGVEGVLERRLAEQVDWTRFRRLEVLGIDEIALKKGQGDDAVIISTYLDGQVVVVGILPDRHRVTVEAFLVSLPDALKATLHTVCLDMYESYLQAVKRVLPHAQPVIDRFHVVRKYADEADTVRRAEMTRLKPTLPHAEYPALHAARHAFRKQRAHLTAQDQVALERLRLVYAFREALYTLFQTATSQAEAQADLRTWIFLVREQHIPGLEAFLKTLETFWQAITNFFVRRLTSGLVEGLNTKIRLLLRRAYGLFNLKQLFQRLSLVLDGYPRFA
jgi:transposase